MGRQPAQDCLITLRKSQPGKWQRRPSPRLLSSRQHLILSHLPPVLYGIQDRPTSGDIQKLRERSQFDDQLEAARRSGVLSGRRIKLFQPLRQFSDTYSPRIEFLRFSSVHPDVRRSLEGVGLLLG